MSQYELEGDVQGVCGGVGGVDADWVGACLDGGAYGELRQGGEERDEDQGEEEEATLLQPGQHPGGSLHEQEADKADYQVVGQSHQPAGDEVVGSAAHARAGPGHVPHLQYEAAEDSTAGGEEVSHGQTEDEAGKLTVTKPRPPEQDDGGGGEVGDQRQAKHHGQRQDVLLLVCPEVQSELLIKGQVEAGGGGGGGGEDHLLALRLCHTLWNALRYASYVLKRSR